MGGVDTGPQEVRITISLAYQGVVWLSSLHSKQDQ